MKNVYQVTVRVSFIIIICCFWGPVAFAQNGTYFEKKTYSGGVIPDFNSTKVNLPIPVVDGNPEWIQMYWKTWEIAYTNYKAPASGSGLVSNYLDEAFDDSLYQWDTIFMVQFAKYNHHQFAAIESLDNFYHAQRDNGFIARSFSEASATSAFEGEDSVNPPIFSWVEWEYYLYTGDDTRLSKVILPLEKYGEWLEMNRKKVGNDLYWNTPLGSGMDNTPRIGTSWIDMSVQMQMHYKYLALIANKAGNLQKEALFLAKAIQITAQINQQLWSEVDGIYYDTDASGLQVRRNTLASFWPLLSKVANEKQSRHLTTHLRDPNEYNRLFPFPSLAANDTLYSSNGGDYWRGGSWAPTTYMVIKGLEESGFSEMAFLQAEKYVQALSSTFTNTNTLWENYAPDLYEAGNISRPNFVGWTGLGPISLLFENVIGMKADTPNNTVVWDVRRIDRHGIEKYRLGDISMDLICAQRTNRDDPPLITVNSSANFTLVVKWKEGESEYLITGGLSEIVDLSVIPVVPPVIQSTELVNSLNVLVKWDSSSTANVTGYDIYRCDSKFSELMENRWELITSVGANVTEYNDLLPQENQALEYKYRIAAKIQTAISQPSNELTVITQAPRFSIVPLQGEYSIYEEVRFQLDTNEALEFSWKFGDGSVKGGGTQATHRYSEPGTFLVIVTAVNAEGISSNRNYKIEIKPSLDRPEILLVVGDEQIIKSEQEMVDHLDLLGFRTKVLEDKFTVSEDAEQKALVIISSSVSSADVGAKFRDVTTPVLVYESFLFDDMSMTGNVLDVDYGKVGSQKKLSITNSNLLSHGLPVGSHVVYLQNSFITWGAPALGAEVVATVDGDTSKPCIFTYDTGVQMVGRNAPARRLGMFLENDGSAQLTERGWIIFDAAIDWLVNNSPQATIIVAQEAIGVGSETTLTVTANDLDGEISSVEFFVDGQLKGTDEQAPYSLSWIPETKGEKEVWALVKDNSGNVTRTNIEKVNVISGYELWRLQNSLGLSGDLDGDGAPDILEYAGGLDPSVMDVKQFLKIENIGGANWKVTTEAHQDSAIEYIIQYSTNLSSWDEYLESSLDFENVSGGVARYSLTMNTGTATKFFWRLRVREEIDKPSYSQNFNSLAGVLGEDRTWQDDVTLAAWYSNYLQIRNSDGSGNSLNSAGFGRLLSLGNNEADWSLGSSHHTFGGTTVRFGVRLVNKSGKTIDSVNILYDGEQWRRGQQTTESIQKLTFSYAVEPESLVVGNYVNNSSLDFFSKNNQGVGAGLNGNLNVEKNITGSLAQLNWKSGESLWLTWSDINDSGHDHGLSIDNLKIWAYSGDLVLEGDNNGHLFLPAK